MTKKKLYSFVATAVVLTTGSVAAFVNNGATVDPGQKDLYCPNAPEAPTVVVNAETPAVAVTMVTPTMGTKIEGAVQTENQLLPETTEMSVKLYRADSETAEGTLVYTVDAGVGATLNYPDETVVLGNDYYYYFTCTDKKSNLTSEASPRTLAEVKAPEPVDPNVDVLTAAGFGVEKASSYADFSNVKFNSAAVYAANITKNSNGSIQMRVSDLSKQTASGIVTTTSGGCVRKVSVTWDAAALTANRTLQFFGSHTPYTSPADLYDEATRGTLINEVTFDAANPDETKTAEFEITDANYEYIGIRSAKSALYVENITITWGEAIELPATALYTETADVVKEYGTEECFAPIETVKVEGYEDHVLVKAWAGVEGYDMNIYFNENGDCTGIEPIENGESRGITNQWYVRVNTGLTTTPTSLDFCIYDGYAYAYSDPDTKSGYVLLYGFVEDSLDETLWYYIQWPQMPEEYKADMETVNGLYQELALAKGHIDSEYAAFADDAKVDEITKLIDALYTQVEEAGKAYAETRTYTSPLTEEAVAEINNAINKYSEDVVAAVNVQTAKYNADGETLAALYEELEALQDLVVKEEDQAVYDTIEDDLNDLVKSCQDAWETCCQETAEYVSPLTDEAVGGIRARIQALQATGVDMVGAENGALYFDLNGMKVKNPVKGNVYIRVLDNKASKVVLK